MTETTAVELARRHNLNSVDLCGLAFLIELRGQPVEAIAKGAAMLRDLADLMESSGQIMTQTTLPKPDPIGVHLAHCYQGENEGMCKYGDDDCPAKLTTQNIERRPTWEPLQLRCKACGHESQGWQPSYVPVNTWIAHIQSMQCSNCCADYKSLLIVCQPVGFGELNDTAS